MGDVHFVKVGHPDCYLLSKLKDSVLIQRLLLVMNQLIEGTMLAMSKIIIILDS